MVEVGVAQLRRELKEWLAQVAAGGDVVITDRGRPVARLQSLAEADLIRDLEERGLLTPPPAPNRPQHDVGLLIEVDGQAVSEEVIAARDTGR